MHRVLPGYSQYYNRKYRRSGHLLQARHKAILCQSDRYLSELVRYIHLNPVRARMVRKPENYAYVRRAAEAEGLTSLRESALKKVFAGTSTLHEINRVTFVEEINLGGQR
jgi:type II secretory ATPase GspE/PulE/Tfp pilus assembly ATPase PilB-like protein